MFDIWLNEIKLSNWALDYCTYVKDDSKIRKYITHSHSAYLYCKYVEDRPEVRKNIKDPFDAYLYCTDIRDDIEWIRKLCKK